MRIVLAFLLALIIGVFTGPIIISQLRALKFGQNVREEGLKEHYVKQGTPTMGGFIFIIAILISTLVFNRLNTESVIISLGMILFGLIGFLDDFLKIKKKQSEGLTAREKLILNLVFSIIMGLILIWYLDGGQVLTFNIIKATIRVPSWLYIPFIILFYTAVTNSVNLADGVDGLCGSVTLIVVLFYLIFLVTKGSFIQGSSDMATYSAAAAGGLLAYLYYNWNPAKVMMGDTGSFALGGFIATISLLTYTEILFIITGLIYVIEALSVIIQVLWFKKTGKRIFLMAPIHHHFEKKGWSEVTVVIVFSAFTAISCLVAWFILK